MRGGGKFQLEAGEWIDDTSMALCIAASLIETKHFDLYDQATRLIRWRSGNGSLMRLAPVAMAFSTNLPKAARACAALGLLTAATIGVHFKK